MFLSTRVLFAALLLVAVSCGTGNTSRRQACPPRSFADIKAYFRYDPDRAKPLIMAHRGGPEKGYPENCIPTFERCLAQIACPLIEFDVRMSRDSVLALLHDEELSRCTDGQGNVSQTDWAVLQNLRLKDENGHTTQYTVPDFASVLAWFQDKAAILILDVKPGVALDRMLAMLRRAGLQHQSVLICYSLADAEYVYRQMPDLMLALGFNNEQLTAAVLASGIPKDQLVALTPRELQAPGYYRLIHDHGISCSLGANGNIDTLPTEQAVKAYIQRFQAGADILCTDKPAAVAQIKHWR